MRLLKPSKFKGHIWKGTCINCGSEFECDRSEIESHIHTPHRYGRPEGEDFARIDCSECNQSFTVVFHFDRILPGPPPTTEERR